MVKLDAKRTELKKFLRARRAALTPNDVGLKHTGPRRTPGLRREELATLAGVSITWYTWLEQGRDIRCSGELLLRLSRALRLSASDLDYLFRLAGHPPPLRSLRPRLLDPWFQSVLDGFTIGPALVLGPRLDVLLFNVVADALFHFDARTGPLARNQLWRGFLDEERRRLYVDWYEVMNRGVGALRANYAMHVGDTGFEALIAELRQAPEFTQMWNEHRTLPLDTLHLRLRAPDHGVLDFMSTRMILPTPPDHIALFLCPTDAPTRESVARLR